MKHFLLLATFIILSANVAFGNTVNAVSCSQTDVQNAINSASNGDTVMVPGGSCTYATNVLIANKYLTLNGQGITTITTVAQNAVAIHPISGGTSRITGFTFLETGVTNDNQPIVQANGPTSANAYRIDHNTFTASDGSTLITVLGNGPGLIDHNTMTAATAAEIIHDLGLGAGNYAGLQDDIVPGGSQFLFIEDNTFQTVGGTGYAKAIENFYGARITFRHNTLINATLDTHGHAPGGCSGNGSEDGTRWFDINNNSWQNSIGVLALLRAGSGVLWNNHLSGAGGMSIQPTQDCTSGTWPVQAQIGRGLNPTAGTTGTPGNYSPTYIWGNDSSIAISSGNPTFVLIGTAPTDATNCSAHAGNVCDAVSVASQPSSLQRCESAADVAAGGAVTYNYVPYTYPHPLQGTSVSVSPPRNLTAVVN